MAKGTNIPRQMTIANAIGFAIGEISSLAEEIREVVDGASGTPRESTQRIQTLDETAGTLESVEEPDIPAHISDLQVTFFEFTKKRGLSRGDRRDNAAAALDACIGELESFVNEREDESEAERNETGEDDPDGDDEIMEAQSLLDRLDEIKADIEGCEFPGMFG